MLTTWYLKILFHLLFLVSSYGLNGTIQKASLDHANNLTVIVVSSTGQIVECAPVTSDSAFALSQISATDGLHLLYIIGSTMFEYNSIIVSIASGTITAAFERGSSNHALILPSSTNIGNKSPRLYFFPLRPTTFRFKETRWYLSDLPLLLWRKKLYIFVIMAFGFIIWFPRIFHHLPKEMREELTGDPELDLGDPNMVIKSLLGEDRFAVSSH